MNEAEGDCVVLVAEDEAVIAMLLECALENAGLRVCGVAVSEKEALDLAARVHPTHAICDVRLSPGDGRRVALALHELYHSAIVFCTAYHEQVCRDADLPPSLCLNKPYDPEHVILALHAARQIADGVEPDKLPPGAVRCGRRRV